MGNKAVKFKDNSGNAVYPCPYYPIGSIYMSVNNINPSNFFGGTWEQIKDRFLLACGSTYKNGATGGEATHKIEDKNLPYHAVTTAGSVNKSWSLGHWDNYSGYAYCFANMGSSNITYGQAINHMPPYLAVYVWKRTA